MNLAGYLRVSTAGQVDAFGKDVQREGIERYASLSGDVITEWFEEDAVSGKTEGAARPVMAEILARADEFDGVIAFDATRIARRLVVQETLIGLLWAAGLTVVTSTNGVLEEDDEDPTRVLIRQILGVVAEFEHRTIVKRLQSGRRHKIRAGGYGGGTPLYGVRVQGSGKSAEFAEDPVESMVVAQIKTMYASGDSLRAIAHNLNMGGITTKLGKQWTAVQVSRILKRYECV